MQQVATKQRGIEDVLYEKGLINDDQLTSLKFESANTGKTTQQLIKSKNLVKEDDYVKAIGDLYGIAYIDLSGQKIDPVLLELVPVDLAKKYRVAPFEKDDSSKTIAVAMVDPLDLQTIEFIERKTGYHVVPYISAPKEIDKVVDSQSGKAIGKEINAALEEITQNTLKLEGQGSIEDLATLRDAPIARIVGMLLETAVRTGASDVHIEPYENATRLRYRIDGILEEKRTIPKEMHESLVARIKILSKLKIDEKRVPQDGRFKVQANGVGTDLRVSTLPTVFGEKVVIRLLKEEGMVYSLADLGLRGLALKRLEEAALKPVGMILVTGPTGSGKTVTNATLLSKLNTSRVNIITLEDPVEIRIEGINQVQVNTKAGLTFATGLRAFLRQDPNIIMVGEIRDAETAELAVHAALTGHLVLSTLHTNSAAGALPRMLDMGVENFLLASTINAVVAQRLVRKICNDCKEEIVPPEEIVEGIREVLQDIEKAHVLLNKDKNIAELVNRVKSGGEIKIYKGRGCDKCGQTGYKGRLGIFEVLEMSEKLGLLILESAPTTEVNNAAKEEGMLTFKQDGYLKVLEGLTTLEEVLRVAKG